jgi:hypothetical protein
MFRHKVTNGHKNSAVQLPLTCNCGVTMCIPCRHLGYHVVFLPFLLVDHFPDDSDAFRVPPCCLVADATFSSPVVSFELSLSPFVFVASCGLSFHFQASESSPRTTAVMTNESIQAGLLRIRLERIYARTGIAHLRYRSAGCAFSMKCNTDMVVIRPPIYAVSDA